MADSELLSRIIFNAANPGIVAAKSAEVKRRSERTVSKKSSEGDYDSSPADGNNMYRVQQQERAKIVKFALSRGFDYGDIMKLMR